LLVYQFSSKNLKENKDENFYATKRDRIKPEIIFCTAIGKIITKAQVRKNIFNLNVGFSFYRF